MNTVTTSMKEKVLELAVEAVKQQIALATVIIGALLAFVEKINSSAASDLPWVLVPLALTAILGVIILQAMSWYADDATGPLDKPLVRILGIGQNLAFVIAVIAMVVITWNVPEQPGKNDTRAPRSDTTTAPREPAKNRLVVPDTTK